MPDHRQRWPWVVGGLGMLVIGGIVATLLTGGSSEVGKPRQRLRLVIGDLVPLSGVLEPLGPPGKKASELAVAEIAKANRVADVDHTVSVVHRDTETNPRVSVQAARELIESDGVTCITGAWASEESEPTARSVSIPEGVLQISPASTSPDLTDLDDGGLFARTALSDAFQGPTLSDAIAADVGGAEGRTVNIGARDDAYGTSLAEEFAAAWEELGGTVGAEIIYEPEQQSFNLDAEEITAGNPDAFVIADFAEAFSELAPALERTGNWDPSKAWGTDGLASGDLPVNVRPAIVEGMRGTTPGAPNVGKAALSFDKLYAEADPKDIGRQKFDAQQFDATVLCYLAAVAADSTDGRDMADALLDITAPGGTEYASTDLAGAIKALTNGEDIDYTGASGAIDMDENGDTTAGVFDTYQFKGGAIETIGETPVNTGN